MPIVSPINPQFKFQILIDSGLIMNDRVSSSLSLSLTSCTAAGQSVMHLHVIPRYAGDMEEPRGRVRGVTPERREY
jgi:hypothetical protein